MSQTRPRPLRVTSFPVAFANIDYEIVADLPSYYIGQHAEQYAATRRRILSTLLSHTEPDGSIEYQNLLSDRATVTVAYDATVFATRHEILNTLKTDEAAEEAYYAERWRSKTKHRLITSQVTCYAGNQGHLTNEPYKIIVTTGCGINFMGSSSHDEQQFLTGRRAKRDSAGCMTFKNAGAVQEYHDTMAKIFKRMLEAQDAAGVQVTIFPVIGGGVYICQLTNDEKAVARAQLFKAFVSALNGLKLQNIREVVYAIPDKLDTQTGTVEPDPAYQEACNAFNNYQPCFEEASVLRVMNVSMFDAADFYRTQKFQVGFINPGSDRTIGGYYKKTLAPGASNNVITTEELICNLTNTVFVQAANLNTDLQASESSVYVRFPDSYLVNMYEQEEGPQTQPVADNAGVTPSVAVVTLPPISRPYSNKSSGRACIERPTSRPVTEVHTRHDSHSRQQPYSSSAISPTLFSGSAAPASSKPVEHHRRRRRKEDAANRYTSLGQAPSAASSSERPVVESSTNLSFYDYYKLDLASFSNVDLFAPDEISVVSNASAASSTSSSASSDVAPEGRRMSP